jgi:hypothetical protein
MKVSSFMNRSKYRTVASTLLIGIFLFACSPNERRGAPTERGVPSPGETSQGNMKSDQELDLREANVLEVAFERIDEDSYLFEVTLIHDDEGEAPNFADSWHVEDLSGKVLGTRVLLHAHGSQPFARSENIDIPPDITTVVVRGHDMLHGHGGQSMRVDLSTGELEAFLEGAD